MDVDRFIERWRNNEGGAERANFPLFLTELCALLDLPPPDPAHATHDRNDYVFERGVTFHDADGTTRHGRIDLYRRGCFVLEAKQSRERGGAKEVPLPAEQPSLPGIAPLPRGRRSAHRGWDVLMRNAREQAEQYARALPESHGWPPFILTVDVGHAIELFADFSGQGKNYRQFPDRAGYRLYLDDLRDPAARERLRAVWLDPASLDPAKRAARVTRDIARRLASVGKLLEDRGHAAEPVAHFLMRCLFTMFAEDAGLLAAGSFTALLDHARTSPETFAPLLEDLWRAMDKGGVSIAMRGRVRHFNGGLFADCAAIPLEREEIGELHEAARHVWTEVEPAIFGTLLEQALDKVERRRLGAHYTPRAYVERLVVATVIEPLQREWEEVVLGTVERERAADPAAAIRAVHDFHEKLAATRVLDPACGTGNFLYVALELMKRLEGDVLEVLADLGGQEALELETATVHPRNFLGMELNPRAAAIAELVLWLGYLQWQLRNRGAVADPVLEKLENIVAMDAVLAHDGADADGRLRQPRRPAWPEADYIVGNPPFIGKGMAMRRALGAEYVAALCRAYPAMPGSADFVMYWWDRAAELLAKPATTLKRFGFVTTNSITQTFNRRVTTRHLTGAAPISLALAIADHPWTKSTSDAAAVRIAMTVVRAGHKPGRLLQIASEDGLATDSPTLSFRTSSGVINADLTVGTDTGEALALKANAGIGCNGMMLAGRGFILDAALARHLLARSSDAAPIKRYLGGADLVRQPSDRWVIDAFGLDEQTLRQRFPDIYQHLLTTVKPVRMTNRREAFRRNWWSFGEPRRTFRPALATIDRYIGTTETSRHRIFQFIDAAVIPDHMIVCIASDQPSVLGILSSRFHLCWALATGGWLGIGNDPRYSKSRTFDPFPFPAASPAQTATIAALAEELDAARKAVLAEEPGLTLTGLYNVLALVRGGGALTAAQEEVRRRGRVDLIGELHAAIDAAVAAAYGWPAGLDDAAIVARLVALNAERAAEERGGTVRWLRPDYQLARTGVAVLPRREAEQIEADWAAAPGKPPFPLTAIGQTAAVLEALRGGEALTATAIARRFAQGRRIERRVTATLEALARLGHVAAGADGYRLRRAA
jgi:SAM-dependent methyltransferase